MAKVNKSVLVAHSAKAMFDLVDRIEDYPAFLPWCAGATVLERPQTGPVARLDINFAGVRAHFTTVNRNEPPTRIAVELREGPFKRLDGSWNFIGLAEAACKVEFKLHYEFATRLLETVVGPVFDQIAETFVDAFVKRADNVYGTHT
jgi:ribosome-associated toxin RatA of RatAB toxin-antitoxin module